MQIETGFGCNGIVLISAPRSGEEGTTRRIAEDLDQLAILVGNFIFRHITVTSGEQLIEHLSALDPEIGRGFRPIIHFDAHGNKDFGLEIGATGEIVDWDTITSGLRKLNVVMKNNLFVFVAACYGFYLLRAITIRKPCPFFIMFGPSDIVSVGEVEDSVAPFYKELIGTGSVEAAQKKLSPNFEYFHSERMFLLSFARYIREECLGKGGRLRCERLLTETLEEKKLPNTRVMRRKLRQQIKSHIKPTPALMLRYSKRFMHGKECAVSFAQVMSAVKGSYS